MGNTKNAVVRYKLGVLFAAISVICGIIVYSAPGLADVLLSYLTHSTFSYAVNPFNIVNFVLGAVLWFVIGIVIESAYSKLGEFEG